MRADYIQRNGLELGYGSLLSGLRLISPIHFPRYGENALIALSAAVLIKSGPWLTLHQLGMAGVTFLPSHPPKIE